MALNLSRNTRVFASAVKTGHTASNTWELLVLDGYSFSQDANADTVTLNEAGDVPERGQKIFTSSLNPVEVSFTTYIRPFIDSGDSNNHKCIEQVLWEGIVGAGSGNDSNPLQNSHNSTTKFDVDFENSNVHELLKMFVYFKLGNITYRVDNVQINAAEVDFSIDGIAQITWTGFGTKINEEDTVDLDSWVGGTDYTVAPTSADYIKNKLSTMKLEDLSGENFAQWTVDYGESLVGSESHTLVDGTTYTADITVDGGTAQTISIDSAADLDGDEIQDVIQEMNNQLDGANVSISDTGDVLVTSLISGTGSSISITDGATNPLFATLNTADFVSIGSETTSGSGSGPVYNVPITGGSLSIDNGITTLTPEELAIVNQPLASFTGTRAISGSVTAYLRTGSGNTAALLSDLAQDLTTVTQEFRVTIAAGGSGNTPRAVFILPHAHLVIPSFNVEDVISTEISFTGLGQEITARDELFVEYYASTTI